MYIYECTLTLHEPLFFATRELGRLYETGRHLHNYALAYAFGLVAAPWFNAEQVPRYAEDLHSLNGVVYCTPAMPLAVTFQLSTFKYGEEVLHVQMQQATRNTPSFGRAKELATASTFRCYVLSTTPRQLPGWVRLGKWHSKARVEVVAVTAQRKQGVYRAACTLNPLDMPDPHEQLRAYDLVSMPPSSLVAHARCDGAYFDIPGRGGLPVGMEYRVPPPESPRRKSR